MIEQGGYLTVAQAVARLAAGKLVGLPTETVYGLGADALNPQAVAQIFTTKGRPTNHPLITHIAADADITQWVDAERMSDVMWQLTHALMAAFFPGPLTLVLPRHPQIDAAVTGGQDSIALRAPNHVLFQDVLSQLQIHKKSAMPIGIAAPSANRFGKVSPTRAQHVIDEFAGDIPVLDGDESVIGIESTIVDLTAGVPKILRYGHILPEDIERVTGIVPLLPHQLAKKDAPRSSGQLLAHYAPNTPLQWLSQKSIDDDAKRSGAIVYQQQAIHTEAKTQIRLPAEPIGYARGLYHALRQVDAWAVDVVWIEDLPDEPAWAAVKDRLSRAIVGSQL